MRKKVLLLEKTMNYFEDSEGYRYKEEKQSKSSGKTLEHFKWSKNNPYKAYNMRLLASRKQKGCVIVSSEEELINSSNVKIKFICPICKNIYEKKWCHWIAQEDNKHFCSKCSVKIRAKNDTYDYKKLYELYANQGLQLLASYEDYLSGGQSYARLCCMDKEGYKYAINLNSLRSIKTLERKFIKSNPYSIENLQKFCDESNIQLTIIKWIEKEKRNKVLVKCVCGNYFETEPYKITSFIQYRCSICSHKESSYEERVRKWLENNNIPFIKEYGFCGCKDKRILPFDFKCNFDGKIFLIEVDGSQHYYEQNWFNNISLEERKRKDEIKSNFCKENNYILIRLPFWDFNNNTYINKLNKTFFE